MIPKVNSITVSRHFLPVLQRAAAGSGFKDPGEGAEAAVAGLLADEFYGLGAVDQEVLGPGDAVFRDVFADSHAGYFFEDVIKLGLAETEMSGDVLGIQFFVVIFFHKVVYLVD